MGNAAFPSRRLIRAVDFALAKAYGRREGRRGVGDPLDGLVLTILSQNTSDVNSDRAFERLKQELPTWREVLDADFERVEEAIRPGGISRIKAERIQQVLGVIEKELGTFDLRVMDEWGTERILDFMVALPGVGQKDRPRSASFLLRPARLSRRHPHLQDNQAPGLGAGESRPG